MATERDDEFVSNVAQLDQFYTRDSNLLEMLISQAKLLLDTDDDTLVWSLCAQRMKMMIDSSIISEITLISLLSAAIVRLAKENGVDSLHG